jgi:branched-chain amino acid transport system permease protein
LRALGRCLLLAGLAAAVTGPPGDAEHPLAGVRGSLGGGRGPAFAVAAFVWWLAVLAVAELRRSARAGSSAPSTRAATFAHILTGPAARARGAWSDGLLRAARNERWRSTRRRRAGGAALVAGAAVLPLFVSGAARQSLVNDVGLYALLALGLNVVVGYAGLLDLGYIAFFAIGAYTTAYLTSATAMPWHAPFQVNPFLVLPVALVVAAAAGVVLGAPTLRLRGDYLAIVTLGFGEIVQLLANNADGITNGARGVFGVPSPSVDLPGWSYSFGIDPLPYYYLLLTLIVAVVLVLGAWERSATGRAWAALREDADAAEAAGVPTVRMKLLAFAVGASVSGFAGVVLAAKQFFSPQSFSVMASFLVLAIVIFGGMGSRLGVIMGAAVLQGTAFLLRDVVPSADRFIYFGAVVVIMMIYRPQGLLPPAARRPVPRRAPPGAPEAAPRPAGEPPGEPTPPHREAVG